MQFADPHIALALLAIAIVLAGDCVTSYMGLSRPGFQEFFVVTRFFINTMGLKAGLLVPHTLGMLAFFLDARYTHFASVHTFWMFAAAVAVVQVNNLEQLHKARVI